VVRNDSRFVIRAAALRGFGPGADVYLYGAIPPGASARPAARRARHVGLPWDSYFDGTTAAPDAGARAFVNAMLPADGALGPYRRAELWALADRPGSASAQIGPFVVEPGGAVLRVVVPSAFERGAPARVLTPRWVPNPNGEYERPTAAVSVVDQAPSYQAPPAPAPTVSAVPDESPGARGDDAASAGDAAASAGDAGGAP
jgi:hypothetical protein